MLIDAPSARDPQTELADLLSCIITTADRDGGGALAARAAEAALPLLENGVRSGMRVAKSLGCNVPWSGSVGAEEDANSAWVGGQVRPRFLSLALICSHIQDPILYGRLYRHHANAKRGFRTLPNLQHTC